jgi:hypothetical protein
VDARLQATAAAAHIHTDGTLPGQQRQKEKEKNQQQQQKKTGPGDAAAAQKQSQSSTMGGGGWTPRAPLENLSKSQKKKVNKLRAYIQEQEEEIMALPGAAKANKDNKKPVSTAAQGAVPKTTGGSGPAGPGPQKQRTPPANPHVTGCCWCGSTAHGLKNCDKVKNMPVLERWDRIRERARTEVVCFACLNNGHKAPECDKSCGVKGCLRRHAALLHLDEPPPGAST